MDDQTPHRPMVDLNSAIFQCTLPMPIYRISDFIGLHSRKYDDEVQFYAVDILVSDGEIYASFNASPQEQPRPAFG